MADYKINLDKANESVFDSDLNADAFATPPADEAKVLEICREYDNLDYPVSLRKVVDQDGDSYWLAEHPDLTGCSSHGDTPEAALANLADARRGWIYCRLCDGAPIPEPKAAKEIQECSGKILLRLPKELHYRLLNKAAKDETSLNQEILYLLASAIGAAEGRPGAAGRQERRTRSAN